MAKGEKVERPLKKSEFQIVFGSLEAQKGWINLLGTQRTSVVDAWMQLTTDPLAITPKIHPLRGELATVRRNAVEHLQRQLELSNGARIWFYVEQRTAVLVNVHTRHPNQTK